MPHPRQMKARPQPGLAAAPSVVAELRTQPSTHVLGLVLWALPEPQNTASMCSKSSLDSIILVLCFLPGERICHP